MLERDQAQMQSSIDGESDCKEIGYATKEIYSGVRNMRRVAFNVTSENVSLQGLVLKDEPIKIVDLESQKPLSRKKPISRKEFDQTNRLSSAKSTPKRSLNHSRKSLPEPTPIPSRKSSGLSFQRRNISVKNLQTQSSEAETAIHRLNQLEDLEEIAKITKKLP